MQKRIKVLGINDDRSSCQCCGREGLKRVVWLEIDGGEPVHYGTSCAALVAGIRGRWTARRADALASEIAKREERLARRDLQRVLAQEMANRTGLPAYVGYYGHGIEHASSVLTAFDHAWRELCERCETRWVRIDETFMPEAVQA
jgi:hypothetical protein